MCAVLAIAGTAWITLLATFMTAVQSVVPGWVRGRALSLYQVAFQGATIVGSFAWGSTAQASGVRWAFAVAGAGLLVSAWLTARFRLAAGTKLDMSKVVVWDQPRTAGDYAAQEARTMVTVEYRVSEKNLPDFIRDMKDQGEARRRDGASDWCIYRDAADAQRIVEVFIVESWAEHLRQHDRTTATDLHEAGEIRAFHIGAEPPAISHLVSVAELGL